MKTLLLSTAAFLLILLSMGCESNTTSTPIANVNVGTDTFHMCGYFDTCAVSWPVEFYDKQGSGSYHWYWTELRTANGTTYGKPEWAYNNGSSPINLTAGATHFKNTTAASNAEIYVGSASTSAKAASYNADRGYGQYTSVVAVPNFSSDCPNCFCSGLEVGDRAYYYSYGIRADSTDGGIVKVESEITVQHGDVCAEYETTDHHAHSVGFVNISHQSSTQGITHWAQTGFYRHRLQGDSGITLGRYLEIQAPGYYYAEYDSVYHGSYSFMTRLHELELDVSDGTWHCSDDGSEWKTINVPQWANVTGTAVQWTGEAYCFETRLPGTDSYRCVFDQCYYDSRYNSSKSASFNDPGAMAKSTHPYGRNRVISDWEMEIWDTRPPIQ